MGVATGVFQYTNGSPAANAQWQWKLSGDAILISGTAACVAPPLITGLCDANGNMTATFAFNDVLSTTAGLSTTYQLTVKATGGTGGQIWDENYYLTGTAANINTIPPGGTPVATATITAGAGPATFSTAGLGYFYGPGWTWPEFRSAGYGISNTAGTFAGGVAVIQFNLYAAFVIRKTSIAGFNGATLTSNCSFGIYSTDGNTKIVDTGVYSVGGAATLVYATTLATPATLTAGTYLLAQTMADTNGSVMNYGNFGNPASNELVNLMNQNAKRVGWAANTSTAGALPTTLGTITIPAFTTAATLFPPIALPFFEP